MIPLREQSEGQLTIGLYAINPRTQRCKWVAIDADYNNALEDLLKLQWEWGRMGWIQLLKGPGVADISGFWRRNRCWRVIADSTSTPWKTAQSTGQKHRVSPGD
jgi:hypothetical protein